MTPPKRLHVKTWGCQMNVYDSERMAEAMAAEGYALTDAPEEADLVLFNTCHIREKAAEKLYSELGRLRKVAEAKRAAGGSMLVGVAGCVAQAEGEEVFRRAGLVDLVVGPQALHRLPDLVRRAGAGSHAIDTDFPEDDKFALPRAPGRRGPTAFLTVQEGCDKFCSFCVVPYTRGAEVSRPAARVLEEARALAAAGVVELTLLGQNVNAWRGAAPDEGARWTFARLIREIARIEGIGRVRYTTSHPIDMDDELIALHGDEPKLMPWLHLPVQSGSDRVLRAMNRRHGAADYLRLVERLRAARPDLALSGDFIVGHPGETEADFEETLALIRAARYAQAYTFRYSPRPGTPAAERPQVDPEAAADRLRRLQALVGEQQAGFAAACVGRRLPVLIEKPGREPGQMGGRSPYLQPVHLEAGPELAGRIVPVDIVTVAPNSLTGRLAA